MYSCMSPLSGLALCCIQTHLYHDSIKFRIHIVDQPVEQALVFQVLLVRILWILVTVVGWKAATNCWVVCWLWQTLARQLAEVLLRGVCEKTYRPIDVNDSATERTHPKPRKYSGDRSAALPLPNKQSGQDDVNRLFLSCNNSLIITMLDLLSFNDF